MKDRDYTVCIAKTKTQISCMVTGQLICAFAFAYAKSRFFLDVAHDKGDKGTTADLVQKLLNSPMAKTG